MRDVEIFIPNTDILPKELESRIAGMNLADGDPKSEVNLLVYDEKGLSLSSSHARARGENPISFNFEKQLLYHRRMNYSLKKESLACALGAGKGKRPFVWDLTCGTGKDSMLILSFGVKVAAFERDEIIGLLLFDAFLRASKNAVTGAMLENFSLEISDPMVNLSQNIQMPDVLYYDPMYEDVRERKALPRKEMRIFQEVVLPNDPPEKIFNFAKKIEVPRLVIKRSLKGDDFGNKTPSLRFKGKTTRYDVYLR